MIEGDRIEWTCNHVWHTFNTDKFQYRGDKVVEFGCPFCGCKEILSRIKETSLGFKDITEITRRNQNRRTRPLEEFRRKSN